jgi:flagellar basal-body rod modification protein FlgD
MSTTTTITGTASAQTIEDFNSRTFANTRKPSDTLDQNSFLKILVTQLQNQDPSAPLSNNDFAQQVTSFSTLQANQSMQTDMAWLRSSSLIGSTVDVMPANTTKSEDIVSGKVSEVAMVDGVPQIVVNGKLYKMSQVKNVRVAEIQQNPAAQTPQTPATTTQPSVIQDY